MATIKEIAEKNNVSMTTVSRVLNYDTSLQVSEEIRQKILDTAQELGYKTPRNRRRVKQNKQLNIAVVLWFKQGYKVKEAYYDQIRKGIETFALEMNIKVKIIYNDNYLFDKSYFDGVDGIIGIGKFGTKTVRLFESCTKNLVFVDFSPNPMKYDSIVIDFRATVKMVLDELILKGYDRIGYIGGVEYIDDQTKLGERRGIVFKEYLTKRDMFYPEHMHLGKFNSESGYNLMKEALEQENIAEVYFCGDDSIALGALKAIHESGLRVPNNVGLIGFNDSPTSEYVFPALSSVHVFTEMIGKQSLVSLLEQVDGREVALRKVIPTYVKHRQSLL